MSDSFLAIFVGSLMASVAALFVLSLALQEIAKRSTRNIDIDSTYQGLDEPKRNFSGDADLEVLGKSTKVRLAALYVAGGAVLFAVVLRIVFALSVGTPGTITVLLLVWALLVFVPLIALVGRRTRRLAVLEIASILQLVARGAEMPGQSWEVRCARKLLGGDLFGEEEEDRLILHLTRTEVAPIILRGSGTITVADAGLGRTVRKNVLRQLRLQGWFVNEISDTEVMFARDWSLHDTTYVDIASYLTWLIDALGLPLDSIRLAQTEAPYLP